jgi:hypothetical protein
LPIKLQGKRFEEALEEPRREATGHLKQKKIKIPVTSISLQRVAFLVSIHQDCGVHPEPLDDARVDATWGLLRDV